MTESYGLDKGFLNWRGRRVFLPVFGVPRIVPSAEDERRVVGSWYVIHFGLVFLVLPACLLGAWLGKIEGMLGYLVAVVIMFALRWLAVRRLIRGWPALTTARFANTRLVLSYWRSLPFLERLKTFGGTGLGLIICVPFLMSSITSVLERPASDTFLVNLAVVFVGPGLLSLLAARYFLLATLALFPLPRGRYLPLP